MADDLRDGGAQAQTESGREANAAAVAIALDSARDNPELSGPIAGFLTEQRALIAEQRHHLREELKRVKLGVIDQRFSIALKAMTALVGLAIAGGLAFMTWDAFDSDGLVVEAFSVPPDFIQRGLNGQTVASRILDRLTEMQKQTNSQRAPQSIANYWGDDIKVEIPETGISLGQLDRFLRERLGHPTHVTGEAVQTASGISLTARIRGGGSATVNGSGADFDELARNLGEAVYKLTQPSRVAFARVLAGNSLGRICACETWRLQNSRSADVGHACKLPDLSAHAGAHSRSTRTACARGLVVRRSCVAARIDPLCLF